MLCCEFCVVAVVARYVPCTSNPMHVSWVGSVMTPWKECYKTDSFALCELSLALGVDIMGRATEVGV